MAHHFEVLKTNEADAVPLRPERSERLSDANSPASKAWTGADDEIAKLVQRVFILPGSAKVPSTVAFCGVESGGGCSWICARCAESLAAQVTGSVCMVDANLRSPSLHQQFQLPIENGFSDVLTEVRPIATFAKRVGKRNLWVVTSGTASRDGVTTLNIPKLHARFSELRAQFDYVLIDTAPVASFAEGVLLAQMTDGTILVVGSDSTRRESARVVKESLDAAKVTLLGVVLNRRSLPIPERLYRRL